jgi:putative sterol carrier protein
MTLEETTEKVKALAVAKGGAIGSKIKFQFDEGIIYLDDTVTPATVSNADEYANCTVRVSLSNFNKLISGDMNAMGAFMMGKIKVDGDMSIAMKLSNLF